MKTMTETKRSITALAKSLFFGSQSSTNGPVAQLVPELHHEDVGRPHSSWLRQNPLIAGGLYFYRKDFWSYAGIQVNTAVTANTSLFGYANGNTTIIPGATPITANTTIWHTNMDTAGGQFQSPEVLNILMASVLVNPSMFIGDMARILFDSVFIMRIGRGDYAESLALRMPAGGGISSASSAVSCNGLPYVPNTYKMATMPGTLGNGIQTEVMGEVVEQQQKLQGIWNPASAFPDAANNTGVYTTANSGATGGIGVDLWMIVAGQYARIIS